MKLRTLIILLLTSIITFAKPQTTIDSLENKLKNSRGEAKIETLQELALLYVTDSPQKAFDAAHQSLHFSSFVNSATHLSQSYMILGMLHSKTSCPDSALFYFNKALQTSETNEQSAEVLENLGVTYNNVNQYDSALLYQNQALKLQQTLGNREKVALCYKNIGNVYMRLSQFDNALEFFQLALEEHSAMNDQKAIATIYNNISSAHSGLMHYSEAFSYLTKAVAIQDSIGDVVGEAYTLNGIGNFYFRLKVYDKAQEYYTKALTLRNQLGDINDIAASQFNIATVHRDLGNNNEALKYYNSALKLRQQTDNKEAQALILNAIGGLYKNQKMYSKAITNYERALEINQHIGNHQSIASSYERLGMAYKDTCQYDLAAKYYDKSIYEYRQIEDSLNIARLYNYYGNLNSDKGDYNQASWCYERAIQYYADNELGRAYVAFSQGKLQQKFQRPQTEMYYAEALRRAEKCHEKTLMRDVNYSLYLLNKEQNRQTDALSYFEKYVALKDSVENDKNRERIAELEFEADIKVLEHQNEVQALTLEQVQSKQVQFRIYMILLVVVLLAILVFSMLLYRQYKGKKQAFSQLFQKQIEVEKTYNEIKNVNEILGHKNTQIMDSLTYAKRIQKSLLPSFEKMNDFFPENFVFYMPKEIVSGDFYWTSKHGDDIFLVAADCTGHGVPGACMSMMGNTLLNQIIDSENITSPALILNELDKRVMKALRQDEESNTQEDGMAISLIRYNKAKGELIFAGASQKMLVVADGTLQSYDGSIFSIGGMQLMKQMKQVSFEEISLKVTAGTRIYLYSDGFIDQFGGEKDERFSSKRFEKMIIDMQHLDMAEQYIHLLKTSSKWKGNSEQIDDMMVIGVTL